MTVQDFVKLPADHAVEVYLKYREDGDLEKSSELHRAYSDQHGVSLAKFAIETAPTRRGVEAISKIARLTHDAARSLLNNWKTCDHCQSRIKSAATVCRYCQRDLV